jgi:Outer membrane receptor for Fe3+-dicitrate
MQVLEDGISLRTSSLVFLKRITRQSWTQWSALNSFAQARHCNTAANPGSPQFCHENAAPGCAISFHTRNVFGSYGYYRNYTEVDGTVGPFGYYLYYDHRQQDGFREANSDYELNNGSSRFVWDVTKDSQFILTLDFYDENHGEPGGMRRREEVNPPNSVFVEDGFTQTSRFFDRFRLERYYAMLEYQKFFSERTELEIKAFGGYLSRWSKRQRGGGLAHCPAGQLRDELYSVARGLDRGR